MNSSDRRRELRARYRAGGLCTECGRPPEVGRSKCLACLQAHNAVTRKARQREVAAGHCPCGRDSPDGAYHCPQCREERRLASQARRRRWVQEGRCIRCGHLLSERPEVTKCVNCMDGVFTFRW